jgi:hypothetical protein
MNQIKACVQKIKRYWVVGERVARQVCKRGYSNNLSRWCAMIAGREHEESEMSDFY